MAHPEVRYVDDRTLAVDGLGDCFVDDGLLGTPEVLGPASATSLRHALDRYEWFVGSPPSEIYFTDVTPTVRNRDYVPKSSVYLGFVGNRITATAVTGTEASYPIDTDAKSSEIHVLVEPLLKRHKAAFEGIWTTDAHDGSTVIGVTCSLPTRGRTVGQAFEVGFELEALLMAAGGGGSVSPEAALHLVQAGQASVLVGQREGVRLEVKEQPFPTATGVQKLELAKDVASFANSGDDALIVVGLRTRPDSNGDVIATARPFPINSMNVPSVRAILRAAILPQLDGLDIGTVEVGGGLGYGWIFVPAQRSSRRPYLVKGALVGQKVIGTHISIPYRQGEDTAFADAATIHSLLAAGTVALDQSAENA